MKNRLLMAGGLRGLVLGLVICIVAGALPAQGTPQAPTALIPPPMITTDGLALFRQGQQLMGVNNPTYALVRGDVDMAARNAAGKQARTIFEKTVRDFPKFADGWLWLGISLTETLDFTQKHPDGEPICTKVDITRGITAFRTAYECKPDELVYVTYYGEALMTYREDFDAARKLWEDFLRVAKTDMQRVTALTQTARACLNKGVTGKRTRKLLPQEIQQQYQTAQDLVAKAAAICPNAACVKTMQELLQRYRTTLSNK